MNKKVVQGQWSVVSNSTKGQKEWHMKRLGELVDINSSSLAESTPASYEFRYISLSDVTRGRIVRSNEKIRFSEAPSRARRKFRNGDILMATVRPNLEGFGLVDFDSEEYVCSTGFSVLHPRPGVLNSYIYQLLFTHQAAKYFYACVVGSSYPALNSNDIENLKIYAPPLPEQRKIAAILSTWDKAIELVGKQIAAKQRFKRALMQRLLTGRLRFPEFVGEWSKTKLAALARPVSRPENIDPKKTYRLLGVRWYVEGAHIHDVVPGSQIANTALNRVEENDIVYNKMWVTKKAFGIAHKEHAGSYGSTEYPQFKALDGRLDVNFLGFFFNNKRFQYDAHRMCKGTTGRARLNPGDFLRIEVTIPGLREQKTIAGLLCKLDLEIRLLDKKLLALNLEKRGLMQKLLNGQTRVKVGDVNG